MLKLIKIEDILPLKDGLFYHIKARHITHGTLDDWKLLDKEYLLNYSGQKNTSNILLSMFECKELITEDYKRFLTKLRQKFLVQNEGDETSINELADMIFNRFGNKWEKMFELESLSYNPLNTLSVTETETPDNFEIRDVRNEKNKQTTESYNNVNSGGYGFNSTTSQPMADSNSNQTITTQGNSLDNEIVNVHTESGQRQKTREGYNNSVAENLEKEFSLWEHIDIIKTIFSDVDEILALQIY